MIHAIRLGTHAEKDYLVRAAPWFDELVINANLLEASAGASAAFLRVLHKPYAVDPVTYSFALDHHYLMNLVRGAPKRTFRALSERYGDPLQAAFDGGRALLPDDFGQQAVTDDFCARVLQYQASRIAEAIEADLNFLEMGDGFELPPARYIAPYFHTDPTYAWLSVNRRLAETSLGWAAKGREIWIVVSFDGLLLDRREETDPLLETYEPINCAGFLFWPSDFDETRATSGQIIGLRRLVGTLCSRGRKGIMHYGGYFSALLRDEGMVGISHGVGYGEKRDIVPVVGGGIPPAKYYLRAIHDDVTIEELLRLSQSMDEPSFLREVCDCTICAGLINRGGVAALRGEFGARELRPYGTGFREVPTPRVYRLSRFHYIDNKNRELRHIEHEARESLTRSLRDGYDRFREHLGSARLGYLIRWGQALGEALP